MKGLSKKQQKELFAKAELAKKEGYPLVGVFKDFAEKENRAFGSIRNYYYRSVADGLAGNLTAKSNEYFTESAENELIACFLRERKACGSIRKAAFIMASGDPVLALRYQNKFFNWNILRGKEYYAFLFFIKRAMRRKNRRRFYGNY